MITNPEVKKLMYERCGIDGASNNLEIGNDAISNDLLLFLKENPNVSGGVINCKIAELMTPYWHKNSRENIKKIMNGRKK